MDENKKKMKEKAGSIRFKKGNVLDVHIKNNQKSVNTKPSGRLE